jgi:exodeoxyribonuclease V alpha subunit
VILQLQKLGLTAQMSLKVYQILGADAVSLVHRNPYQLAELVDGFGFRHADALARRMGLDPGSPERVRGGLHYVLVDSASQGILSYTAKDSAHRFLNF